MRTQINLFGKKTHWKKDNKNKEISQAERKKKGERETEKKNN